MDSLRDFRALIAVLLLSPTIVPMTSAQAQTDCPSNVTINISSIGYSGQFAVDLRAGYRPGSTFIATTTMSDSGTFTFYNVCPGTYFFAIGPYESQYVSVTQYFEVTYDGENYSNPTISVYYTSDPNGGNAVGSAAKAEL
jgi:hypothetical protein